ncbi:MAG TPA: iron-sulfur cluster repair di-iron protein [Acidimicrobiia bacterium]|nr:iron-sulfur cluster repair di-iron protein [Acidimicrobiia bacterium]
MADIDLPDIDPDATLGELVTERPALARAFDELGLDYCCGGGRSLAEACEAAGLRVQVLAELDTSLRGPEEPDAAAWVSMDPAELTEHLEATHHAYLRRELPRLTALADKVSAAHGARHPELASVRDTLAQLRAELEPHISEEEEILFPAIRASRPVGGAIEAKRDEHDQAGELLARLRALSGGYVTPADGCASYRAFSEGLAELEADLHLHVHKENNVLFPAVAAAEGALVEPERA